MDRAALDRPRADQRHLDDDVVDVARLGPRQHLHLRPALDLEDAGGLGGADRFEGLGVVERDPREVEPLAAGAADLLDAALDRREHPQAEQVDLEEARVGTGVLVPLHRLPARHRRRHHRADVDQRPGRDHHPARVLGGVPRQAHDLAGEREQHPPARLLRPLGAQRRSEVALDLGRGLVEADRLRHPVDLRRRQPQRLAEVADGALRAVGGEGGDEGRAVGSVALVHPRDQDLADVAGEVEVDVRHRGRFLVEEAAGEEVGLDRVDVGEAGQVADDRADAGAAAAARRQHGARRLRPAHLGGDLARQLEQVAVEEEEAREVELADRRQLLLQSPLRLEQAGAAAVALAEEVVADTGQLGVGAGVLAAGVAVAQLLGEVEAEPLGEPAALVHRLGVFGEASRHRRRRGQSRSRVAAPTRLGLLQRLATPDRHQRILQRSPSSIVGSERCR